MPRPVYILGCQGSSTDKDSGLFSAFELIEKVTFAAIPEPKEGEKYVMVRTTPFRIIATWLIDIESGERYEDQFEQEIRLIQSDGEVVPLISAAASFKNPQPERFLRITLVLEGGPPANKSGIAKAQARIRKVGEQEWVSQEYPFEVVGLSPPPNNGKPAAPPS